MRLPRFWTPRSRDAVIGAPYLWLGLFFLLPFMLVLRISLAQMDGAQVSPLVTLTGGELTFRFHLTPYNCSPTTFTCTPTSSRSSTPWSPRCSAC